MQIKGHPFFISASFFFLAAAPGCWIPVLANVLTAEGWSHLITWAFLIPPLAGILTPLALAARADQEIAAEKLLAGLMLSGSLFLWLAFDELERGERPGWFLFYLSVNALITAPVWALLNSVTFAWLARERKHSFGGYRVWGTVGWMAAGWMVSLLALDDSAGAGKLALVARILGAVTCYLMPSTPPSGVAAKTWQEALGLGSFRLLKERDLAVFMGVSCVFSMPLAAFYMHTPVLLRSLEWGGVAAGMTIGQMTEVGAMLLMGAAMRRWRIKWLMLFAIGCATLRYLLYGLGAGSGQVIWVLLGIGFHGFCWTYFFEAGRLFLDRRVPVEYRSQIQAMLGLVTGGVGSLAGTLMAGALYGNLLLREGGAGWVVYWTVLAAICVGCLIWFAWGYRGAAVQEPE